MKVTQKQQPEIGIFKRNSNYKMEQQFHFQNAISNKCEERQQQATRHKLEE